MLRMAYTTILIGKGLDLDASIELAKYAGCSGIDFRIGNIFEHGVEIDRTPQERRDIRRKLEDNYLEIASINSPWKFDHTDKSALDAAIDGAKRTCELAFDTGCKKIRVFGNDITMPCAQDVVAQVADSIADIADFAAPMGVDILMEMHGQFNYYGYSLDVMERVARPNVGLLYNCDKRDLVAGDCIETFKRVEKYVRHIHTHELTEGFPYITLFEELHRIGYDGYICAELGGSAEPKALLANYNIAMKIAYELARRNVAALG